MDRYAVRFGPSVRRASPSRRPSTSGPSAARMREADRDRLLRTVRCVSAGSGQAFVRDSTDAGLPSISCPPVSPSPRSNRAPAGPERRFAGGLIDASGERGWTGGALCRMRAGRRRRRARLLPLVLPVLLPAGIRRVEQRPLLPAARGERHPGQGERKTQHPPASGTSRTPGGGRRRGRQGSTHAPSIDGRRGAAIYPRRTRTVSDPVNAGNRDFAASSTAFPPVRVSDRGGSMGASGAWRKLPGAEEAP